MLQKDAVSEVQLLNKWSRTLAYLIKSRYIFARHPCQCLAFLRCSINISTLLAIWVVEFNFKINHQTKQRTPQVCLKFNLIFYNFYLPLYYWIQRRAIRNDDPEVKIHEWGKKRVKMCLTYWNCLTVIDILKNKNSKLKNTNTFIIKK